MVRPKMFHMQSTKWDDDAGITSLGLHSRHLGSAMLDIWISPKPQKTVQMDSEVIKTNKETLKWANMLKL